MAALQTRMTLSVDDVDRKLSELDRKLAAIEEALKLDVQLDISDADLQLQAFADATQGFSSEGIDNLEEGFRRASPTVREAATRLDNVNAALKGVVANNPALRSLTGTLSGFGASIATLPGPLGAIGKGLQNITPAALAATAAVAGLGFALVQLGQNAFAFQAASNQLVFATNAAGEELEALEQSVSNLFTTVPVGLDDAASAVARVSQLTKLTGDELDRLSGQFAQLSIIEGSNLQQQVVPLIGTFRNLGVGVEDYSDKLDVLFATSQAYGTTTERLAVTLGAAGSALRVLGLSFDEAAELAAKFNAANLESSEVINSLATASVNINELSLALEGLTNATEVREVLAAFDVPAEQASKLASSVASGALSFQDLGTIGTEAGNRINEVFERTDTIARQFTLIVSELKVAFEPFGAIVLSVAESFIGDLLPSIREFGDTLTDNQDEILAFFDALGEGLATALQGVNLLIDGVSFLIGLFSPVDEVDLFVETLIGRAEEAVQTIETINRRGQTRVIEGTTAQIEGELKRIVEEAREQILDFDLSEPGAAQRAADNLNNLEIAADIAIDELQARREIENFAAIAKGADYVGILEIPLNVDFDETAQSLAQFEARLDEVFETQGRRSIGLALAANDRAEEAAAIEELAAQAEEDAQSIAQRFSQGLASEIEQIRDQLTIDFNIDTENGINDVRDAIDQAQAVIDDFKRRQEAADRLEFFNFDEVAARVRSGELEELVDDVLEGEGGTNSAILRELEGTLVEAKQIGAEQAAETAATWQQELLIALRDGETDPFGEWLAEYQISPDILLENANLITDGITENLLAGESLDKFLEAGETAGGETIAGLVLGLDQSDVIAAAGRLVAQRLEASIRAELESSSPSKVGERIGGDVNTGIAMGLEDTSEVTEAARGVGEEVTEELQRILDVGVSLDGELDNPFSKVIAGLQAEARTLREKAAEEARILDQREQAIGRLEQFGGFELFAEGVDEGDFDDILREIIEAPNAAVFALIESGLADLRSLDPIDADLELEATIDGVGLPDFQQLIEDNIDPIQIEFYSTLTPFEDGGISLYEAGGVAMANGARMIPFGGKLGIYNESHRGEEVHVGGPKGEAIVGDYHSYGLSFNRLDRIGLAEKLAPMINAKYPQSGQGTVVYQTDNSDVVAGLQTLDRRLSKLEGHARSTARSNDMMADDTARQMALMRRQIRKARSAERNRR